MKKMVKMLAALLMALIVALPVPGFAEETVEAGAPVEIEEIEAEIIPEEDEAEESVSVVEAEEEATAETDELEIITSEVSDASLESESEPEQVEVSLGESLEDPLPELNAEDEAERQAVTEAPEEPEVAWAAHSSARDASSIAIDASNFPDAEFRRYLTQYVTGGSKGYFTAAEAVQVTEIDMFWCDDIGTIRSLQGIDRFPNLKKLVCSCAMSSLDLSKNRALEVVDCSGNGLDELILGNNPNLRKLSCCWNDFTRLEIGGCPKLISAVRDDGICDMLDDTVWFGFRDSFIEVDRDMLLYENGEKIFSNINKLKLLATSKIIRATQTFRVAGVKQNFLESYSDFTFKSSNTKVATVSKQGVVKGIGKGTATITVKDLFGRRATCKVSVLPKIAVKGVKLNAKSARRPIGATLQLSHTLIPSNATNKAVTWKSSNSSVAKVSSSGKVTALKLGTAKITVQTKDGAKKAVCTVVVTRKDLAYYFGKNYTSSAKAIGGLKYFRDPNEDENEGWGYKNSYMRLMSSKKKNVDSIWLFDKKSPYSIKGVKIGMARGEVLRIMQNYECLGDDWDLEFILQKKYVPSWGGYEYTRVLYVRLDDSGLVTSIHLGREQ